MDDFQGSTIRRIAKSLFAHLNATVGQCKSECDSFMYIGIHHEHKPRELYISRNSYIKGFASIDKDLLVGKEER